MTSNCRKSRHYGATLVSRNTSTSRHFKTELWGVIWVVAASLVTWSLQGISDLGFDDDYAKQREEIVKALTVDDIKALGEKYIRPDKMIYLVVGDAATQLDKLEQLGFGKPVLLNPTYEALDQ